MNIFLMVFVVLLSCGTDAFAAGAKKSEKSRIVKKDEKPQQVV